MFLRYLEAQNRKSADLCCLHGRAVASNGLVEANSAPPVQANGYLEELEAPRDIGDVAAPMFKLGGLAIGNGWTGVLAP